METPYNENLLLSSGVGNGADLVGESVPLAPGRRNQGEVGVQQALGKWAVADFGYFNKRTDQRLRLRRAVRHADRVSDFLGSLEDRRLHRPRQHRRARRVQRLRGDGAYQRDLLAVRATAASSSSRRAASSGSTTIRSSMRRSTCSRRSTSTHGVWAALSWRYDSGLVAGSVPDFATALALSGDQQAAIGLFCGSTVATRDSPIASCSSSDRGAKRLVIPADGTEDDVNNPPRVAPRHIVRPRFRRRQPVPQRQGEGEAALQRAERDEQGGALQLPVDVHRHTLRQPPRLPGACGSEFLAAGWAGWARRFPLQPIPPFRPFQPRY